ncbi:MAG TPA: undecaprenyl-diphosphate phosphatase [Chloroflexota bacterium]|nr:undecaprenyl-diphosphate phosphatase [Chloroflexota bacterium]
MDPLHAIVLGAVQGLGEFLPISSSAHLVLAPWLLGWPENSLTFDVALHMGTLAALLIYFWRDWWVLIAAWLPAQFASAPAPRRNDRSGNTGSVALVDGNRLPEASETASERALNRRLGIGLVIGTIPAAVAGVLFEDVIEGAFRAPALIAISLIVASFVLLAADRLGPRKYGLQSVTNMQAALIGVAQAFALIPGVSRSGITLAAALFIGLTREAGARYAFLLAAPITAGAGVFQLRHLVRDGIPADEHMAFALGILTSFLVGMVVIGALLRYLRRGSLVIFVVYRIALGLFILAMATLRTP